MGLRDVILSRFVKLDLDAEYEPSPEGRQVMKRQSELERQLDERQRRRDLVRAQVRSIQSA